MCKSFTRPSMKLFIMLYTSNERIALLISSTPFNRRNFTSFPNTLIANDICTRRIGNAHVVITIALPGAPVRSQRVFYPTRLVSTHLWRRHVFREDVRQLIYPVLEALRYYTPHQTQHLQSFFHAVGAEYASGLEQRFQIILKPFGVHVYLSARAIIV